MTRSKPQQQQEPNSHGLYTYRVETTYHGIKFPNLRIDLGFTGDFLNQTQAIEEMKKFILEHLRKEYVCHLIVHTFIPGISKADNLSNMHQLQALNRHQKAKGWKEMFESAAQLYDSGLRPYLNDEEQKELNDHIKKHEQRTYKIKVSPM
jgi:hypothetical protein